jgi:1A family penicillin-binding protein
VIAVSTYINYANEFKSLTPKSNTTKNIFYDKNGKIFYESFGAAPPTEVTIEDVPQLVIDATLASEDSDFYQHGAIDPAGIARAALINFKNSKKNGLSRFSDLFNEEEYSQGGSTITQQLVKNIYLSNERSFDRKIKEVVYAYELERKHTKDDIFEMYLNNVYFGEQSLGIVNASKIYFGKELKQLSLAEVSMIVGLPAAPSRLSPISGDFEAAKERQKYVLSQMYYEEKITLEEAQKASATTLNLNAETERASIKYPYFVDYVKKELRDKLGEEAYESGGLKIHTTLDPGIQKITEQAATKHVATLKYRNVTNAAALVLDNKTGEVRAMLGGLDYNKSKVNVTTSKRQPGSSFKPIVYTAGLLNKYTASSRLWDGRVNFGGIPPYIPRNYDGGYRGYVTVRTALSNSLNVPAVEMTKLVGVEKVLKTAELLGIDSLDQNGEFGLSIGLGSGEVTLLDMVQAYSTFANLGERPNPTVINSVVDSSGSEIYLQPESKERVLDPKISYIMTSILSDNYARRLVFGSNSVLQLGNRPVAAKTGTTDSFADNWTMGYTPQYTVGVWVGNNDHSVMRSLPGLQGAAPIWNSVMKGIHQNLKIVNFEKPKGLEEVWISPYTGLPSTYKNKPNVLEYFLPGTAPDRNERFDYLRQFR